MKKFKFGEEYKILHSLEIDVFVVVGINEKWNHGFIFISL